MAKYRLYLKSGERWTSMDERCTEEILEALSTEEGGELPPGWTWIAGLYVRRDDVIAIAECDVSTSAPRPAPRIPSRPGG